MAAVDIHSDGERIMSVEALIITLLIGGIAGWLAATVMRGRGLGVVGNIVVGILGAFLASFLLPRIGIVIGGGWLGAIIHAFIGAVILLFLISLVKRA
ncbi:MAG TPA: GlsB/YeaQ/YmgE family stress response membrane protein [Tahibacter sp.]|nr:GlsB/YeaQ/YmgE family stress response membrane protein [Tahibacter sp.]